MPDPVPKHQGHTGTGCYKLHDHEFVRPRGRPARKGGGPPGADGGSQPPAAAAAANLMDLPVADSALPPTYSSLKHSSMMPSGQRAHNQVGKTTFLLNFFVLVSFFSNCYECKKNIYICAYVRNIIVFNLKSILLFKLLYQ